MSRCQDCVQGRGEPIAGGRPVVNLSVSRFVCSPANGRSGAGDARNSDARDCRRSRIRRWDGAVNHRDRLGRDDHIVIPCVAGRMGLVRIFVRMVGRYLELPESGAVGAGPVYFRKRVVDD